jgi:hypothetical protein
MSLGDPPSVHGSGAAAARPRALRREVIRKNATRDGPEAGCRSNRTSQQHQQLSLVGWKVRLQGLLPIPRWPQGMLCSPRSVLARRCNSPTFDRMRLASRAKPPDSVRSLRRSDQAPHSSRPLVRSSVCCSWMLCRFGDCSTLFRESTPPTRPGRWSAVRCVAHGCCAAWAIVALCSASRRRIAAPRRCGIRHGRLTSVYPSGAARATRPVPMLPPAPPIFSTMMVWPSGAFVLAAKIRRAHPAPRPQGTARRS